MIDLAPSMKLRNAITGQVNSLLRDISHYNPRYVADALSMIPIETPEELELVVRTLFSEVLANAFLCEAYADIITSLRFLYPEFPPQSPEEDKPATFSRMLLNIVQEEFESIPDSLELPAEAELDRMLNCVRFIGHLFARKLIAVKVIGQVAHHLIGIREGLPAEHQVLCACELVSIVGQPLDVAAAHGHGKMLLSQILARLVDLVNRDSRNGSNCYSEIARARIEETVDMRQCGWPMPMLIVQVEEVCLSDGAELVHVIKVRSISGKECASIEGTLVDRDTEELHNEIAEEMGVLASRIRVISLVPEN